MIRPNNAIARLEFMKLSKTMRTVIHDCKSMLRTVFIAKHVILKTHHKILFGSAQRVEAGLITPICEGDVGQFKNIYWGKQFLDPAVIIPSWKEMASQIACRSDPRILLRRHFTNKVNCIKKSQLSDEVDRSKLFSSPTSALF